MATTTHIKFGDYLTVTDEGSGVIRVDGCPPGGGAAGLDSFALTGGPFTIDDSAIVLDGDSLIAGSMHFSTVGTPSFDVTGSGRARILRSGLYVIGCQVAITTYDTIIDSTTLEMQIKYAGDVGYGIEVPWMGFPAGDTEQILGTFRTYAPGTFSSADIGLQRIHPISLTDSATFPVEIQPAIYTHNPDVTKTGVQWLGLWGFRVSDHLDAFHSD